MGHHSNHNTVQPTPTILLVDGPNHLGLCRDWRGWWGGQVSASFARDSLGIEVSKADLV